MTGVAGRYIDNSEPSVAIAPAGSKVTQNLFDLSDVVAAKKIDVDKERIEVVDRDAILKSRLQRCDLLITFIEGFRKPTEQLRERQLHLVVTVVDCGIEQDSPAGAVEGGVAAPGAAMEKGRPGPRNQIRELSRHPFPAIGNT